MAKKKKGNPYSMIMQETMTYGTAGVVSAQLSGITGDATMMRTFKIGSSLAGVPSLLGSSKGILKELDKW